MYPVDYLFSVVDDVVTIDSRLALHVEDILGRQRLDAFEVPVRTGVLHIEVIPFHPLSIPRNYLPLSVNCDVSATSLADAARIIGPAFVYDLYVHPYSILEARFTLRRLQGVIAEENPLAPHINLHPDDSLDKYEWYLVANGKGCGSRGV